MSSAMHSGIGFVCYLFIIETRGLVISLFRAGNLPMGKRNVSFSPIPDKPIRIDGKFRLLSNHPKNKSGLLDRIISKEDTLFHRQMLQKSISFILKVSSAHASR